MHEYVLQLGEEAARLTRFDRDGGGLALADQTVLPVQVPMMPRETEDVEALGEVLTEQLTDTCSGGFLGHLVIPASWCFWERVTLATDRFSDEAALFEFEQFVPVELERLTCTVTRMGAQQAIVSAAFTEPLRALLDGLEAAGFQFSDVTTDLDVARRAFSDRGPTDADGLIVLDERHAYVALPGGVDGLCIRAIGTGESSGAAILETHLRLQLLNTQTPNSAWRAAGLCERATAPAAVEWLDSLGHETSVIEAEAATKALSEATVQQAGLADFRHGALAFSGRWESLKRKLTRCAAAAAVFFVALACYFHVEGSRYAAAVETLRHRCGEVYREATASETVPPAAALRLRSERIKLEGLTDTGGAMPDARASGLASLELLHTITAHVPPEVKLHVDEVLLDEAGVRVSGQTTSHNAAGEIVQQLNTVPGLVVDPPRTKLRRDKTVDFRLHVRRQEHDGE